MDKNSNVPISKLFGSEDRRVTRSQARALERQVVGSILTQIDTGIQKPVDFVPVDYLNKCAELVFGRLSSDRGAIENTGKISLGHFSASASFSRKLEALNMSECEEEGVAGGEAHRVEQSLTVGANQLGQMMALLMKQNEQMSMCMDELKQVRSEVISLGHRVASVEESKGAESMDPPCTSTPGHKKHPEQAATVDLNKPTRITEDRKNHESARPCEVDSYHQNESVNRKHVNLDSWHIKFDGLCRDMTVESFVFRIEKMREQYHITFEQLFTDFHCLVTGRAAQWYWQILEDNADDVTFGYFSLRSELLNHFKTADSDYEIIREIIDRKQQPGENFDDFYTDVHNLTFRLKKRIPELELVSIIRGNLRTNLAALMFSSTISGISDLRRECRRAEKLLKESRLRSKAVHEVSLCPIEDNQKSKLESDLIVESIGTRKNQGLSKPFREDRDQQRVMGSQVLRNIKSTEDFCNSPFHLNLCFVCGMPGDFYKKLPMNGMKLSNICRSNFHNMICFICGNGNSYCDFEPNSENMNAAGVTGASSRHKKSPEMKSQ